MTKLYIILRSQFSFQKLKSRKIVELKIRNMWRNKLWQMKVL